MNVCNGNETGFYEMQRLSAAFNTDFKRRFLAPGGGVGLR